MLNKDRLDTGGNRRKRIADAHVRLYRVALALCGDPMLADDLVQETLATGISNCRQLRAEDRLFAWLYSILNNVWRGHVQHPQFELDERAPAGGAGPCDDCETIETVSRVRSVVATLPLVDLEGVSYCDVAQALDIPTGTVMSRLHRARRHLLEHMEEPSTTPRSRRHIDLVE